MHVSHHHPKKAQLHVTHDGAAGGAEGGARRLLLLRRCAVDVRRRRRCPPLLQPQRGRAFALPRAARALRGDDAGVRKVAVAVAVVIVGLCCPARD